MLLNYDLHPRFAIGDHRLSTQRVLCRKAQRHPCSVFDLSRPSPTFPPDLRDYLIALATVPGQPPSGLNESLGNCDPAAQ